MSATSLGSLAFYASNRFLLRFQKLGEIMVAPEQGGEEYFQSNFEELVNPDVMLRILSL